MGTEDFELTLFDRLNVIRDTIAKYGEGNFYVSFSGGKDSTILSHLIDEALPGNRIPRVFINTGIEYLSITKFVMEMAKADDRFVILKPSKPIKEVLERYGYPFKSKEHSHKIGLLQRGSTSPSVLYYASGAKFGCPAVLMYQTKKDFGLKLSAECCRHMKKDPSKRYERESGRHVAILGIRQAEGGMRRFGKGCIITRGGTIAKFKPLNPVSDEFMDWYAERRGIRLCELYYPPYSLRRTGCKGCPYALDLQRELETMETYFPAERRQCEILWAPVYKDYRDHGYRLKKNEQMKLF